MLVDTGTSDDAGVYRLDADRALVITADFFTPIVDDPFDFGRIAAANALSDIYAMGARPLFAINLVAFPRSLLDEGILGEIVRGGDAIAANAGVPIIGGHSIDDPEPKYGLCVIGQVHPEAIMRNSTARAGDELVLTKPIGTGVIATAIKSERAADDVVRAAVDSMTRLNREAAEAMVESRAHAATDVTGFGLLGHLHEVALHSGLAARLRVADVPLLPGALELAAEGHVPGGTSRNLQDLAPSIHDQATVDEPLRILLADAQTSGGLLICLPAEPAAALVDRLVRNGHAAARVGSLEEGEPGRITLEH